MKRILLASILFSFFIPAFSQQATDEKYLGNYEFRFPGSTVPHYIILTKTGDKLTGRYLGFYPRTTDTIYYLSTMKDLEITGDGNIKFSLNRYRYSSTPLRPGKILLVEDRKLVDEKLQSDQFMTVPARFSGYSFSGTISTKMIKLTRYYDWADSQADNMEFIKTSH